MAAVALIGGGAFAAYTVLSGGGPQPAEAIPSDAIAYARVDLDPSADQKINAVRLLRNVPEFEAETGITSDTDDLRRRVFEEALSGDPGCTDIDYDDDIAPWIGDRAAVAAVPAADPTDDPDALITLQVTDTDAATDGLQALFGCAEDAAGTDHPGLAFVGDYAVVAETQDLADRFADEAESSSLADDAGFQADMAALDGEGLMSFWVDADAVVDIAGQDDPEVTATLDQLGYGDGLGTVSAAVRAQSDALELVVAADSDLLSITGDSTDPATDVKSLPDTTMMAVGFTGGREAVNRLYEQIRVLEDDSGAGLGPQLDQAFAQLRDASGLSLPDDLGTLLGDQFTLAVDGAGFDFLTDSGQPDFSTINIGARMQTDTDAASAVIGHVQDLLTTGGLPFELATTETDDGLVVAANQDYADALAEDGSLGDSDGFTAAVADPDNASAIFYLDLDKVSGVAQQLADDAGADLPRDQMDLLDVFRAVGAATTVDGDYSTTTVRVVFD